MRIFYFKSELVFTKLTKREKEISDNFPSEKIFTSSTTKANRSVGF